MVPSGSTWRRARSTSPTAGSCPMTSCAVAPGAHHSYFGHADWDAPRAGAEVARGRAGDPPSRAARVRARRARTRRQGAAADAHLRGGGRRPDRCRGSRRAGRDAPIRAGARLPAHRYPRCHGDAGRGRPADPAELSGTPLAPRQGGPAPARGRRAREHNGDRRARRRGRGRRVANPDHDGDLGRGQPGVAACWRVSVPRSIGRAR